MARAEHRIHERGAVTATSLVRVPKGLSNRFERLVEDYARRWGETPESARRAVEQGVLARGIEALEGDAQ